MLGRGFTRQDQKRPLIPTLAPRPGPCAGARAFEGQRTCGSQAAPLTPQAGEGLKPTRATVVPSHARQGPCRQDQKLPLIPTLAPRPGPCAGARAFDGQRTCGSQAAPLTPQAGEGLKPKQATVVPSHARQGPYQQDQKRPLIRPCGAPSPASGRRAKAVARAKNQKPKTKNQKPKAKSQKPKTTCADQFFICTSSIYTFRSYAVFA